MERQATQPAAVPSGRKRRRVSHKKQKEDTSTPDMRATRELEMAQNGLSRAEALDLKATQPPTSELVMVLNALPRADPPPTPPPTISPVRSVNDLMEGTLKDYKEECVEEGTFQSDPSTEVGEWEVHDLDQMDTQLNQLLFEACPFHPHRFIECVNPRSNFGPLRLKCPQEGCPVYLFEDTREIMMETLKEDTHPQVRARLQRGEMRCKCGLVPKMKLSRTAKNYNKVFFSCGSFFPGKEPCGYFQWLHGPLWCPRETAQPTLRQWVHETPRWVKDRPPKSEYSSVPRLNEQVQEMKPPWERNRAWFDQFAESAKAQEREYETRRHLHKNFGSSCLF